MKKLKLSQHITEILNILGKTAGELTYEGVDVNMLEIQGKISKDQQGNWQLK